MRPVLPVSGAGAGQPRYGWFGSQVGEESVGEGQQITLGKGVGSKERCLGGPGHSLPVSSHCATGPSA